MAMRALVGALFAGVLLSACVTQAGSSSPMAVALEDKYAQNGDVRIHYVASGKGPLVVMIHGYPDFSGSWTYLTPKLNDAYRVVALDTRGYNLSSQPVGVENYEMPKLVADVDAVIKAEGYETATVLGHDWGGSIAWMYAFTHPEKLDNLIILSTPHPVPSERMRTDAKQQATSQYARNFQKEGSEANMTAEGFARRVQTRTRQISRGVQALELCGMRTITARNIRRRWADAKRPFP
jgi:pimeloyl-ACP methyl ester carboxylesterase